MAGCAATIERESAAPQSTMAFGLDGLNAMFRGCVDESGAEECLTVLRRIQGELEAQKRAVYRMEEAFIACVDGGSAMEGCYRQMEAHRLPYLACLKAGGSDAQCRIELEN